MVCFKHVLLSRATSLLQSFRNFLFGDAGHGEESRVPWVAIPWWAGVGFRDSELTDTRAGSPASPPPQGAPWRRKVLILFNGSLVHTKSRWHFNPLTIVCVFLRLQIALCL